MIKFQLVLVASIAVITSSTSYSQSPPPPPPPAIPVKTVGKAKVYYFKNSDKSRVTVEFILHGSYEKILKEDYFTMGAEFEVPGKKVTQPQTVMITLFSYTHGVDYRYKNNNQVTLFINKKTLLIGNPRPSFMRIDQRGGVIEHYTFSMPYENLLEIVKANQATLKLGVTKFELRTEHINALKDLYQSIE